MLVAFLHCRQYHISGHMDKGGLTSASFPSKLKVVLTDGYSMAKMEIDDISGKDVAA